MCDSGFVFCCFLKRLFLFCAVEELQVQRWNAQEKRDALCPNVMAIIRRFNLTSSWAQTLVVRASSMEARVAIMRHLLDICYSLLEARVETPCCLYMCV